MNIIFLLIPIAIILAVCFVGLFIWASKNGQYDDLETPAYRILIEEGDKKHEFRN